MWCWDFMGSSWGRVKSECPSTLLWIIEVLATRVPLATVCGAKVRLVRRIARTHMLHISNQSRDRSAQLASRECYFILICSIFPAEGPQTHFPAARSLVVRIVRQIFKELTEGEAPKTDDNSKTNAENKICQEVICAEGRISKALSVVRSRI